VNDLRANGRPPLLTYVWGVVVAGLVAFYLVSLRNGRAALFMIAVARLGWVGVALGIGVMAFFSVLPVPSEFVSVLLMQEYGPWFGTLYSWIGGVVGAVAGFYLARAAARPLVLRLAGQPLNTVRPWVERRGTLGLLLMRFLPMVPYHFVNYLAGILDVRIGAFVWTTAIGILPFQAALASVYSGFRYGSPVALVLGGAFLVLLVLLGTQFRRRWMPDGLQANRRPTPPRPDDAR
jgi:uncharacterized membrane protein YdjX (TVP38/TMEM64 family)